MHKEIKEGDLVTYRGNSASLADLKGQSGAVVRVLERTDAWARVEVIFGERRVIVLTENLESKET